jgi:hypothetical protein
LDFDAVADDVREVGDQVFERLHDLRRPCLLKQDQDKTINFFSLVQRKDFCELTLKIDHGWWKFYSSKGL